MGKPALEVIATETALSAAWKRVSRGKLAGIAATRAGNDGESLESFSRSLQTKLENIGHRLRSGGYKFTELRPFFIPKPNGKKRLICVPTVADRIVQRAVLDFLTPRNGGWLKNGVSHGFVPDLGVPDAVKLAVEYRSIWPWVFKTDISAFFDRIDRNLLSNRVRAQITHRSLHPLLELAINCEISAPTERARRELKLLDVRPGRGVRQGMPLSPFFANLLMKPFDIKCKSNGHLAIRYADDLIFFANSEGHAKDLQSFCVQGLKDLNLQIPELGDGSKTQIYGPSEPADFLGVELRLGSSGRYEVAISDAQMREIKQRIYTYSSLTELKNRGLDITKFGNALRAATAAYSATYGYCSNYKDLKNHLATWEAETLKRVVKALGIEISTMNAEQLWFLGISQN